MFNTTNCFNVQQIITARKIGAAEINICGRQRMLSQRIAFLALRLVHLSNQRERYLLRTELLSTVDLMEKSHNGLLSGDTSMNLLNQPSPTVKSMYFNSPLYVDRQVRAYIKAARSLLLTSDEDLESDHPDLLYIIQAASGPLLISLNEVVNQYQQESEAEDLRVEMQQAELYHQSCAAATIAQAKTQELEKTWHELQQAQTQLIQTEKLSSLGQMIAGIAHEINNPVSYIYGNLSHAEVYIQDLLNLLVLYREAYPEPTPELESAVLEVDLDFLMEDLPKVLASMQIGADRIRQIVLSLRNFSRTDDTAMVPNDLHEGLDTTILILQHRLKAQPHRPEITVIKEYGKIPPVECYIGQINQVFMNLLSNAIDALEEHYEKNTNKNSTDQSGLPKPLIKIQTEVVSSDHVRIKITDNGPGISAESKNRLFETFFTTKPIGKGTGLGLSISRQIISKHSGAITCESELGIGTQFIITLPISHKKTSEITENAANINKLYKMLQATA